MKYKYKFLAIIDFLLFITAGSLSFYLKYIGNFIGSYSLIVISILALLFSILTYKEKFIKFGNYILMSLGSSFTLIIYLSATQHYIGTVWVIHTLLFAYYFLGFKSGLIWNSAFLIIFSLMHLYFYFYPEYLPYDWSFTFSIFGSLFISYIALLIYGFNIEKIKIDRDKKNEALEKALLEIKRTQKQLIESEKMSSLGSLVAGIAHEINTPIGISLTGITHIERETKIIIKDLQNNKLGKNSLTKYLDVVEQMSKSMHISIRTAAQLVRSFKQVAVDQHTENKRDFNLKDYMDEVLLSLHNKIKHSNVEVKNNIKEDIFLYSYAGIYSQMLTNFVINSIVHAFENKEDGLIVLGAERKDNGLYITYEDNGIGLAENVKDKMFDPFFTTKMGKGGSGLGLNIIYNLINHKLGGTIRCESTLGDGMKLFIYIPKKEIEH